MPAGYIESGAVVSGFPAHIIDRLLARHGPTYLAAMTQEQRAELKRAHAAIHRAAQAAEIAADGNAAMVEESAGSDSAHDELTTAQVAERLGVRERQARNLAAAWAGQGLARNVGGRWLVDRIAVESYRRGRGRRAS